MSELPQTDGTLADAQGGYVEAVHFEDVPGGLVTVRGPSIPVRGCDSTADPRPIRVTLGRSYCPWCCREFTKEVTLDLPQVLVCSFCAGVWTMNTPPPLYRPALTMQVNLLED